MSRSWSRWHTKIFSSALLLPIPASSLFYGLYFLGGWLPSPSPVIHVYWMFRFVFVLDFQSLMNRLCAKFHISIFSPSCRLYCLFEQSTAHISFWVRFAILCVDWNIKNIFPWHSALEGMEQVRSLIVSSSCEPSEESTFTVWVVTLVTHHHASIRCNCQVVWCC